MYTFIGIKMSLLGQVMSLYIKREGYFHNLNKVFKAVKCG